MKLEEIVATSAEVASTRARLKKISLLSDCLTRVEPTELSLAVKFLSGELPQGRIGLGAAAVYSALESVQTVENTQAPTLTEVNTVFGEIAEAKGQGSTARRNKLLIDLMARTTPDGQRFLGRLILGDSAPWCFGGHHGGSHRQVDGDACEGYSPSRHADRRHLHRHRSGRSRRYRRGSCVLTSAVPTCAADACRTLPMTWEMPSSELAWQRWNTNWTACASKSTRMTRTYASSRAI